MADEAPGEACLDGLFRSLVQDGCDGIVTVGADGVIVTVNPAAGEVIGVGASDLVGSQVLDLIHPDDLARAADDLAAGNEFGAPQGTSSFRVLHGTEGWVHVDVTSADVQGPDGALLALYLRPAVERQAADDVVMQLLAGGTRQDLIRPVCDLFAWRANHTMIGVSWWEPSGGLRQESTGLPDVLVGADVDPTSPWERARGDGRELLEGVDVVLDEERRALADALDVGPCWIVPVPDVGHRPPALITVWGGPTGPPTQVHAYGMGVARSLVELILRWADQLERLDQAAHSDGLTGLANRKAFLDRLSEVDGAGALLYCDLDGFKLVNDRLGHQAGDELLRLAGTRLQGSVRSQDVVARIGGDEFAVLCEGADPSVAAEVADRVRGAFEAPFRLHGELVQLGISIGIGHAPENLDRATLADADQDLYRAKAQRQT
jgi:diguanylate cyclase (GGDEF)-like protein/PAS domain S-box-containing protein